MFCTNCGKQIPDGSQACSHCGVRLKGLEKSEDGGIKGFFLLIVFFFGMPLKTMKLTVAELRDLGGKGKLDIGETSIPHLTWLQVASHLIATIVIVILLLIGLGKGLYQLKYIGDSFGEAVKGFFVYTIGGVLAAVVWDWVLMIWLEILFLMMGIANDVKRMVQKN